MALYGTLVIKMLQVHPQNTAKAEPHVLVIWRNIYYNGVTSSSCNKKDWSHQASNKETHPKIQGDVEEY